MRRNDVYLTLIFTIIWVILREEVTLSAVLIGVAISAVCVLFTKKFLPLESITGVSYFRFLKHVVYVFGQMYVGAIFAIRLVIKGAKTDVIEIRTELKNDFLRVMLANSITLVPGSVTLELRGDRLVILLLHEKTWGDEELAKAGKRVKGGLENKLLSAQKDCE